ncbi:MAG TPA: GAF domain-containing sensor histidine kinase [Egibacteraceae bacterium]|nr:GAF domain-containing sensor histidine kinase [Egibacteraceae bacterium]
MSPAMDIRRCLPGLLLAAGVIAIAVTVPVVLAGGGAAKALPWIAGTAIFVGAAVFVWRRQPQHAVAWWFAVSAGLVAIVQFLDGAVLRLGLTVDPRLLAMVVLAYQVATAVTGIAISHLLGLFPDGQAQRPYERRVLKSLWWLLALPPIVLVGSPTLLMPDYHQLPDVPNPFHVSALSPAGAVAAGGIAALQGAFILGVALLVLRYRRSHTDARRRIRWLLLPALFAAAVAAIDLAAWRLFPDGAPNATAEITLGALWILTIASLPLAIAIALLRPDLLDVDQVIRKSLVYGLLWSLIAVVYVAAAASLGVAAGRRFPLGLAIALTVAAAVVFQPARQRLERLADRWVFGARADPARLISRLGAALEETVEMERLLPRMADTLQEGLGLRWVRVRLEPAPPVGDDEPALAVPIMLGEERLGVVECGPKLTGALTPDDEAVVSTLARQAALAVRNVRLTAELEGSRVRLIRAQEAERRRIERNIHDGVQQDLVALIGQTAHARAQLKRDPAAGEETLAELQDGLRRVLGELRELAHGIHPSLLGDRGLLEAVEALASRSALPVSVRADPALRGLRFAEEIEGAGYFTVAEALANVSKHAGAARADVTLARTNGALRIEVRDDGVGFDPSAAGDGSGLANLAERLAALGGRLDIVSEPGDGTTVSAQLQVPSG